TFVRPTLHLDSAAVLLGHDVVGDREAEPGPFSGRLCREERLEQLVPYLRWNTDPVIARSDFDRIAEVSRRHPQGRLEFRVASLSLALGGGIEAVADQVQTDAGDVLGHAFDGGAVPVVLLLPTAVQALPRLA